MKTIEIGTIVRFVRTVRHRTAADSFMRRAEYLVDVPEMEIEAVPFSGPVLAGTPLADPKSATAAAHVACWTILDLLSAASVVDPDGTYADAAVALFEVGLWCEPVDEPTTAGRFAEAVDRALRAARWAKSVGIPLAEVDEWVGMAMYDDRPEELVEHRAAKVDDRTWRVRIALPPKLG